MRYFGSDSSNDDEDDDLDIALRRVRDIPLETYLSAEKADIVRKAQEKREFSAGKRGKRGKGKGGSVDEGSRVADSRYMLSGWSNLDPDQQKKHIKG